MILLGLYSTIGGGKSFVARMFSELGATVIDADAEIAKLLAKPEIFAKIKAEFPAAVIDEQIDRKILADTVFNNESELKRLEAILHPPVYEVIWRKIDEARNNGVQILVLDVPLLAGSEIEEYFSSEEAEKKGDKFYKIFVDTPDNIRFVRLETHRNIAKEEIKRREKFQPAGFYKKQQADFIIDNSGTKQDTFQKVAEIYSKLLGISKTQLNKNEENSRGAK